MGREQLAGALEKACIGLVPFYPIANHLLAMPTKVFEYMAAGVPVLAMSLPGVQEILERTGAGLVFGAVEATEIARGDSEAMRGDREGLQRMGERGRKAVREEYSWERSAQALLGLYRDLV